MRLSLLVSSVVALVSQTAEADTSDHIYKKEEHIELWVNKVRVSDSCGHSAAIATEYRVNTGFWCVGFWQTASIQCATFVRAR